MFTRALSGGIVLIMVGLIVGAGLCILDDDHNPSTQLDLCGLFLSATSPTPVAFVLGVMISTLAVLISTPAVIALDLPTPPPKI